MPLQEKKTNKKLAGLGRASERCDLTYIVGKWLRVMKIISGINKLEFDHHLNRLWRWE